MLADAFELYANAYERSLLLKDFYGKEATLGSVTVGSDEDKERSKKGLKGLLEGADKERQKRLMSAVRENLMSMYVYSSAQHGYSLGDMTDDGRSFNNSDKGAVSHAIVHRVLWEYLSAVNENEDEAEREKLRRDMFETYVPTRQAKRAYMLTGMQMSRCTRGDGAHQRWQPCCP